MFIKNKQRIVDTVNDCMLVVKIWTVPCFNNTCNDSSWFLIKYLQTSAHGPNERKRVGLLIHSLQMHPFSIP